MIFAVKGHVEAIKDHMKTETRRRNDRYRVGCFYKVQRKRTAKGEPDGHILILHKWTEEKQCPHLISVEDAIAEGNYTPEDYERLYEKMNPNWQTRTAYMFQWIPNGEAST